MARLDESILLELCLVVWAMLLSVDLVRTRYVAIHVFYCEILKSFLPIHASFRRVVQQTGGVRRVNCHLSVRFITFYFYAIATAESYTPTPPPTPTKLETTELLAMSTTPSPLITTSSPTVNKHPHSTVAIVGGAVGGAAALLLILAAIFIPLLRKRRSCLDIALRRQSRHSSRTDTTISHQDTSLTDEKLETQTRRDGDNASLDELKLEEMIGLEEMLKIRFPSPAAYELDAGSFVEGRANWEIKF
ncbi:hypothetical protein AUEXF2481DRAFT_703942 [Aureobasidium subglaciale EXF-2481]|uniref:Uncharacterized protein n=1 Tax=Aureobasidium subglaciale (strain EXF-2481) TaxID=1043005 RepID=A0A074ZH97_AURSE|nr:uncharacterized protein AUEXF2481DRAFT_703942 [Aureobasidium subglaciale EXF-2481]KEQ97931.1 hypothetical protein AUEXF2481DRAFT_703942 [Aureobasidium subglaciale EXF-2481]